MQFLSDIVSNIKTIEIHGNLDIQVAGIQFDSRQIQKGDLFVATIGTQADGHQFIDKAIEKGAVAVVCEKLPEKCAENIVFIKVENSTSALAHLASAFYGFPSQDIYLVGVTGTNGKTTIATTLYKLFQKLGYKCGLLSTISYFIQDKEIPASHTTPDAMRINGLLREMVDAGCEYCFMEVSSHAVAQKRIEGLHFEGGIFTNITHDHLDYHGTFAEYIAAKKAFFDQLPKTAFALTNIDDRNGNVMLQNTEAKKQSYALHSIANFKCRILENHFEGMQLEIDDTEVWTKFVGSFNAYNLLAIYATAILLGEEKEQVLTQLSAMQAVRGRFQAIYSTDSKTAIVDYAHTPDALKNVLETICEIRSGTQKIITVVGAGGNRDKTKRPIMAKVAAQLSDKVILTSDNPRNENPEQIIEDMRNGLDYSLLQKTLSITNRREAIRTAAMLAQSGDIILIAGKGHETYQEVNGVRHHFDDVEEVQKVFAK